MTFWFLPKRPWIVPLMSTNHLSRQWPGGYILQSKWQRANPGRFFVCFPRWESISWYSKNPRLLLCSKERIQDDVPWPHSPDCVRQKQKHTNAQYKISHLGINMTQRFNKSKLKEWTLSCTVCINIKHESIHLTPNTYKKVRTSIYTAS